MDYTNKLLLFGISKIGAFAVAMGMVCFVYFVFVFAYVNHSSGYLLPHPDGAGNKQGYAVGPLNRTV